MANFCSVADVKEIAKPITPDIRQLGISDDNILDGIAEVSEKIRLRMHPRYLESDFGGNIPPAIRYLCRLESATLLVNRYMGGGGASYSDWQTKFKTEMDFWNLQVTKGTIADSSGNLIPPHDFPTKAAQIGWLEQDLYNGSIRVL